MRGMGPEAWKQKEKRRLREHEIYRDPYDGRGIGCGRLLGRRPVEGKAGAFTPVPADDVLFEGANATLPEALREVGGRYAEGRSGFLKEPGAFFLRVAERLEEQGDAPFPVIWKEEAERFPPGFPLEAGDHKNLLALGENLGYAHKDMQERTLLFYLEETDSSIEFLKREMENRTKLYRCLGMAAGLFLMVVMA